MEKDGRLLSALAFLRDRFGDSIELVDHWDADLRAVGISRRGEGTRLVYLCVLATEESRFDIALELPPKAGSELPYEDGCWRHGLNLSEVVDVVASHLRLS